MRHVSIWERHQGAYGVTACGKRFVALTPTTDADVAEYSWCEDYRNITVEEFRSKYWVGMHDLQVLRSVMRRGFDIALRPAEHPSNYISGPHAASDACPLCLVAIDAGLESGLVHTSNYGDGVTIGIRNRLSLYLKSLHQTKEKR